MWSCSKRVIASAAGCSITSCPAATSWRWAANGSVPQQLRVNKLVAELGLETLPDARHGRAPARPQRPGQRATAARSRRCRRRRSSISASRSCGSTGSRSACRSKRRGRPIGPSAGTKRPSRRGFAATRARPEHAILLGSVHRGGVRGRAPRHVVAARAGVHALRWWREQPHRRPQRRAAGSPGGRLAAHRAAARRAARRRPPIGRTGSHRQTAHGRRDRRGRRRHGARSSRHRVDPARARGPYRVRARAPAPA